MKTMLHAAIALFVLSSHVLADDLEDAKAWAIGREVIAIDTQNDGAGQKQEAEESSNAVSSKAVECLNVVEAYDNAYGYNQQNHDDFDAITLIYQEGAMLHSQGNFMRSVAFDDMSDGANLFNEAEILEWQGQYWDAYDKYVESADAYEQASQGFWEASYAHSWADIKYSEAYTGYNVLIEQLLD